MLTAGVLTLAGCISEPGAEDAGPGLGTVNFTTSCSTDVQPGLERGLALLHHMMYEQARDVFRDAARREESCAMAHWGVAMSRFQPLWGSAQVEEGRDPAERAVALEPLTERERATRGLSTPSSAARASASRSESDTGSPPWRSSTPPSRTTARRRACTP